MKKNAFTFPESSFLSIEKDYGKIIEMILKNNSLKKLLFYTKKDCLSQPSLNEEQTFSLFGKNIKIIPKLELDETVENYIVISFDNFMPNGTNPEFRDNILEFDIICNFDQWTLTDFQLRPYKIAGEIDSMFNNSRLSGIGKIQFLGANQLLLTDKQGGLCLMYQVIHGEEDKKNAPTLREQQAIEQNFNEIFNS